MVYSRKIKKENIYARLKKLFQNYQYDINNEEVIGSHVLSMHVNVSDEELKRRITCNYDGENIKQATTFSISPEQISDYINQELHDSLESIAYWLASDEKTCVLSIFCEESVGYGYKKSADHDWNQGPLYCKTINVVLKRHNNDVRGFIVLTAYLDFN